MGGDYQSALPGARTVYTPEYLASARSRNRTPTRRSPNIQGDPSILPPWIVELHNRLAPITA